MKHIAIIIIFIFVYISVFSQNSSKILYLHGSYNDTDWEQLEFIPGSTPEKGEIYYNYADSKKGKIKLEIKERLEMGGKKIMKIEFPVIKKRYYITFSQDFGNLTMTDEKGEYEKIFYYQEEIKPIESKSTGHENQIKSAFRNYIKVNPDYCSEADCEKARENMMSGNGEGGIDCFVGIDESEIEYKYGDINQDGQTDCLVYFGLIQCDGGNALCDVGGQALVLSGLSTYKVLEPKFEDGEEQVIHNLLKINADGTILSEDWYWTEEDPRCIPSLSKKVKYKLEYNTLIKTY